MLALCWVTTLRALAKAVNSAKSSGMVRFWLLRRLGLSFRGPTGHPQR